MTKTSRLDVTVHGIVQGVFFRHHTRIEATSLGLVGTVRNQPNGSVRVIADGPRDRLERLLEWLRHGPELAVVERVDAAWSDADGTYTGFDIIR